MDIDASIRNGSDTMKVPIPAGLTLNVMLANTEKEMGGKFLKYSAYNNNCQDFIMAVLKSNGLGDDAIYSFVKQDTKSLFSDNSFLRKVSNTITDIGARVNTAIFGAGSKEEKPIKKDLAKIKSAVKEKTMPNKWITFVKDYASSNGMSYRDALKDPNCKAQYKSGAGFFEDIADGVKAVFGGGMPTNADAYVADAYDATQLGANAGKRKSK
jgi:hypothetical protein